MNKALQFAYWLNDEKEKANEAGRQLEKKGDMANADKYYMRSLAFSDALQMAEFLLKSAHESNHSKAPIDANTVLGDVPPLVETPDSKESAGALCKTGSVRQNEQTQEVCRFCQGSPIEIVDGQKHCSYCDKWW